MSTTRSFGAAGITDGDSVENGWKLQTVEEPGAPGSLISRRTRFEQNDPSASHPEKVEELLALLAAHNADQAAPLWPSLIEMSRADRQIHAGSGRARTISTFTGRISVRPDHPCLTNRRASGSGSHRLGSRSPKRHDRTAKTFPLLKIRLGSRPNRGRTGRA